MLYLLCSLGIFIPSEYSFLALLKINFSITSPSTASRVVISLNTPSCTLYLLYKLHASTHFQILQNSGLPRTKGNVICSLPHPTNTVLKGLLYVYRAITFVSSACKVHTHILARTNGPNRFLLVRKVQTKELNLRTRLYFPPHP